jgi:thermostable 8-oxoguanine DNA glycosylase
VINVREITNFRRSEEELQGFLLFCIAVAGKNAELTARSVNKLLREFVPQGVPVFWHYFSKPERLDSDLRAVKIGQYGRIHRAIMQVADLLLGSETVAGLDLCQLLAVYGIGPKTARFFILHTRPGSRVAVLDTHILTWMRNKGYGVPETATPQNAARYGRLERAWLAEIETTFPGKTPAEADLLIWLVQSGRLQD